MFEDGKEVECWLLPLHIRLGIGFLKVNSGRERLWVASLSFSNTMEIHLKKGYINESICLHECLCLFWPLKMVCSFLGGFLPKTQMLLKDDCCLGHEIMSEPEFTHVVIQLFSTWMVNAEGSNYSRTLDMPSRLTELYSWTLTSVK